MSDTIYLVQGDTLPALLVSLTDANTGGPINISTATSVIMRYFANGASQLTDTLTGTVIAGLVNPDGSINSSGIYATPGVGGRVSFAWNPNTLAVAGQFRGEIAVTFPGPLVQTAYETLRFQVRPVN